MILLHLTDIHADIHNPQNFLLRFQHMIKALSHLPSDWKPDAITLTGDFGYDALESEFQLAETGIRLLFKETNLTGSQTICCEGNHDAEYTTYPQNSFFQYKAFFKHMEIAEHPLSINGTTIFSLNSCTQTTPDLYNHAVLTNTFPEPLPPNSILIMHHPPHLITPLHTLKKLTQNCRMILSGHIHPETPSISLFGNTISENGCAFTPMYPNSPWGCQLIRFTSTFPNSPIELGCLLSSSTEKPDFNFSVKTYTFK